MVANIAPAPPLTPTARRNPRRLTIDCVSLAHNGLPYKIDSHESAEDLFRASAHCGFWRVSP